MGTKVICKLFPCYAASVSRKGTSFSEPATLWYPPNSEEDDKPVDICQNWKHLDQMILIQSLVKILQSDIKITQNECNDQMKDLILFHRYLKKTSTVRIIIWCFNCYLNFQQSKQHRDDFITSDTHKKSKCVA